MKARKGKNAKKRLEERRKDFDATMNSMKNGNERGYRRPGSTNPRKNHGPRRVK